MTNKLHEFLSQVDKEFGENSAVILDENKTLKCDVIPTGISVIDEAIGVKGIPRGRITEVFGNEGCGKTSLCLHTIAQAQKMGLDAMIIDAEHALSTERMHTIGVDTSRLVISQPDSGEDALNIAEMAVRSGKFAVIVIDSVAALVPMAEIEKDMGDSVMGVHARLMSQAMRKLAAPVDKFQVALIFTNQTRSKIGGYGAMTTTTGGNALKFYASLRIEMKYVGKIEDTKGNRISGKYKSIIVKNKLAVPFKSAEFEINNNGIDESVALVDQLIEKTILIKSGTFIKFQDKVIGQGVRNAAQAIHDDSSLKDQLLIALEKV
jgi:recombination protein RecA